MYFDKDIYHFVRSACYGPDSLYSIVFYSISIKVFVDGLLRCENEKKSYSCKMLHA